MDSYVDLLFYVFIIIFALVARQQSQTTLRQPPRLSETIPFVSNGWQFLTNKRLFINRVREALRTSPVIRCRLGPTNLYIVGGGSNAPAIFQSSFTSDPWILRVLEHTAGYSPTAAAKFAADGSGCAASPRTDSGSGPPAPDNNKKRIWHAMRRAHEDGLLSSRSVSVFAATFQLCFDEQLAAFQIGEWHGDVRVFDFLKRSMAAVATRSVCGSLILDANPGFVEAFWEYAKFAEAPAFGSPRWLLNRKAVPARERFRGMCSEWYKLAEDEFDWDDGSAQRDVSWEPVFGSRISRGLAQWGKLFDFSAESLGAAYALLLFGLHANTIPICAWVVMEIIKDPHLLHAVRKEISEVRVTDDPDNTTGLDYRRLASLPLLQSVYTEALRLYASILITRTSTESVTIGGYEIPKGSVFQAPTEVAHLDEAIWGTPAHPASEFWAHRHVQEVETVDRSGQIHTRLEFSMAGREGYFFPFGGGNSICAGHNFAKPEVLLTVAMIITRFEIEFVEWLKPNGSRSNRPAQGNTNYANAVATPPDREMRVKWRRM